VDQALTAIPGWITMTLRQPAEYGQAIYDAITG
jgi:hypothetical protein